MLTDAKRAFHERLSSAMVETLGLDLDKAAMRGDLGPEDQARIVRRCSACADADGCQAWLEGHGDGASEPPAYCRNTALFEALKL
ncbi:MAG: DUF6455 family protein [Pseudomonadota bacterium]